MDINYKNYHRDDEYNKNKDLFRNIFLKRYNLISKYTNSPKRVLDIGCSNGIFLDLFKHSETWGVEPSRIVQSTQYKVHRIINTKFENAKLPENYFDLVIMNHTLEHVKDADLVLEKIYKILKKGGILFIDVPNAGGLGSRILGDKWAYKLSDEHNYQFTRASLSKKIKDSGFNILYWESRSGLFELANPLLDLWQSLIGLKKRFITNVLASPYHLVSSVLQMGDSMSFVARKN
ncbi:MAG: class I SAM-dependent methyltransferase [Candidatus Woesearchaeota archaeon]|jgi:SAM-dependent methyltransferase